MSSDPHLDESKKRLEELQRDSMERLRAGLGRVNRLEESGSLSEIEKRIQAEYTRYNAVRPELGD